MGQLDACLGLGQLHLQQADGQPELIQEELHRRAFAAFEKGMEAVRNFRGLLEEGLLGRTAVREQEALEMEAKGALGMARFHAATARSQDALTFATRALTRAEGLTDPALRQNYTFRVQVERGAILGASLGEWKRAIEEGYDGQLQVAQEYLADEQVADAQYNLALACYRLGDYSLARSTVLTCMDTIKVRCLDRTKGPQVEGLLAKIFSACEMAVELETLGTRLQTCQDAESRLDYLFQRCKLFARLERLKEAYADAKRLPTLLKKGSFSDSIKYRVYQLVSRTACEAREWPDAMFFARKWLEAASNRDENDDQMVECLLLLLRAHLAAGSVDVGLLVYAEQCGALLKGEDLPETERLEYLSSLSRIQEALGSFKEATKAREECLGLAKALSLRSEAATSSAANYDDLEDLSYFADRKVSRTTRSLMGGDFQMQTRAAAGRKKAGGITNRRAKAGVKSAKPSGLAEKRTRPSIKKLAVAELEEASSSDLGDFIASLSDSSSSEDGQRENRRPVRKQMKSSIIKPSHVVIPSSGSEHDLEDEFATAMSITGSQRQPCNDDGAYGWYNGGDSSAHEGHHLPEDLTPNTSVIQPYQQLALRIRVQVGEHSLVVPCFDDDIAERKRVSWLIREAARRYAELDAKEPIIRGLSYSSNSAPGISWLSPSDPVALVLTDGQTVLAHIEGWRRRSWAQEYQYQQQRLNSPGDLQITELLEAMSADSMHLDLSFIHVGCPDVLLATLKAKCVDVGSLPPSEGPSSSTPHIGPLGLELTMSGCTGFGFCTLHGLRTISALDASFSPVNTKAKEEDLLTLIRENLPRLQALNVSFMEASGSFVSRLLALLACLDCPLAALDLSGLPLGDNAIEGLHYLPRLTHLHLDAISLSDSNVAGLADLLPKSGSLAHLSLTLTSPEKVIRTRDWLPCTPMESSTTTTTNWKNVNNWHWYI